MRQHCEKIKRNSLVGIYCCRALIFLLIALCVPAQTLLAKSDIKNSETIISASETDYPPFCLTDEKNQADGFSVELLRAALKVMGREVSYEVGPWNEVKQKLIDRQVQVLPLVGRTPEREALFDFTFPYITLHGTIIVRNDVTDINSLADLVGKSVAVMKGDNAEEFLDRVKLNAAITATDSFDTALLDLSRGKYDAVVIQKLLAMQLINEHQIHNLKVVGAPLEQFVQSFCFAVPKGEAQLLGILNEGLSIVLADGTFDALRKKWFSILDPPNKSRIIVGGDSNYPPYEYLDKNGQPTGYNVELTKAIANRLGLSVDIQLGAWSEIREKLARNEIDLVQGMFYSPERDKIFDFSPAHTRLSHVAVARKETRLVTNLDDMAGKIIVVVNGDIIHDLAIKAGLEKQLVLAETQSDALLIVANGEADYALVAEIPARYWIEKSQLSNLHIGTKHFVAPEYCYATNPDNRELLEQFAFGLADLKADGEYRAIYQKWLGIYDEEITRKAIIKYSLYVASPLLLLLLVSLLWGWILKKKVKERTAALRLEATHSKESEDLYRTLVNAIPDLVWLKDAKGVYLFCNKQFERLFGAEEADILGKTDHDFVDNELADFFAQRDRIAMEEGRVSHNEEWVTFAEDGQRYLLETTKVPMYHLTGELIGVLGVARDITKRKLAEDQRAKLEDQIRQKSKIEALGLLAGGMAHNFNNNLTIVLGNLELLRMEAKGNSEQIRYIDDAKIGVNRSRELIQQIMAYSRSASPKLEPIDLIDIVAETLKLIKSTLPSSIFIQYQPLSDHQPAIILANSTRIQEALLNLCNNAVHAMNGQGTLSIQLDKLTLTQKDIPIQYGNCCPGDFVRIRVKDTGVGIENEVLGKIFDPFFTTKDVNVGTGMGLATVQGLVKDLSGMISVVSALGKGTTIELCFPLSAISPKTVCTSETTEVVIPPGTERILIVDDDQMIATLSGRIFTENGYQVTTLDDSPKALDLFKSNPGHFDLVISDQTMPGMTGKELLQEMLKIRPTLPTILCTGNSNVLDKAEVLHLGIKAILEKPIPQADFLDRVRQILDENKQAKRTGNPSNGDRQGNY